MSRRKQRQERRLSDPPPKVQRTLEPLKPKNKTQAEYIRAISTYDQVLATGVAGSGKTHVPARIAVEGYLSGKFRRIIVARPAVSANEDLGFLPGTLQRKLEPWALPITDVFQEVMGKVRMEAAFRNGDVELASVGLMRGRTFKDSFVLIDEAQNATLEQLKLIVTRIGENTKLVICGDTSQTDIGKRSGLDKLIKLARDADIPCAHIVFSKKDVVRSGLCSMWVEAFERVEDEKRSSSF